jgi:hypothetical protein
MSNNGGNFDLSWEMRERGRANRGRTMFLIYGLV